MKTKVVQVPGNRATAAVPVMQRLEAGTRAELATAKEGEAAAGDSGAGVEDEARTEADEEVEAEARPGAVSTAKAQTAQQMQSLHQTSPQLQLLPANLDAGRKGFQSVG